MTEARKQYRGRALVLIALTLALSISAAGMWYGFLSTYHFAVVQQDTLYRDGLRSKREFKNAYRRAHFKTVVCLVTDKEFSRPEFQDEAALCREKGVELIRVPVNIGMQPLPDDIDRFLKVAQDKSKWPVLVHCAQGIQRTGMMVAAYQKNVCGYDKQKALDSVLLFNKGNERAEAVKDFIEKLYSPQNATGVTSATTQPIGLATRE